jgi:hypothetical protein
MSRSAAICSVLLVGLVQGVLAQAPAPTADNAASASASDAKTYTVPAGTKLLLALKHEVSTRVSKPGDTVYFTSEFPVVQEGVVVIPAGMFVKGIIDKVERPGKVKGRAQLQLHLASIIFPNGVEIAIPGNLSSTSGSENAKVVNSEGTVEANGTKGRDAERITSDTLAGTGVGALGGVVGGNIGMGAGIGGGIGATAGVLTTLLSRGNDIVFGQGATMEMVLARPLVVQQAQLNGMSQYTGVTAPTELTVPKSVPAAGPATPSAPQAAIAHK